MLKETLQIVRDGHCQTGDAVKLFYQRQNKKQLQIDIPALPRGKANRHRGSITLLEISEDDILNYYSGIYSSLFNAAITGIDSRYHTLSMELASVNSRCCSYIPLFLAPRAPRSGHSAACVESKRI